MSAEKPSSMKRFLKTMWHAFQGVAVVSDNRTGGLIGAVAELNKLERLRHELTIALRQAEDDLAAERARADRAEAALTEARGMLREAHGTAIPSELFGRIAAHLGRDGG